MLNVVAPTQQPLQLYKESEHVMKRLNFKKLFTNLKSQDNDTNQETLTEGEGYFQYKNECHYVECHYVHCHYAECHYAQCHYAECHGAIPKCYPVSCKIILKVC